MPVRKFWMVQRDMGAINIPRTDQATKKHFDYFSAETEMKRLAREFPGGTFVLLEAIEAAEVSTVVVTKL